MIWTACHTWLICATSCPGSACRSSKSISTLEYQSIPEAGFRGSAED